MNGFIWWVTTRDAQKLRQKIAEIDRRMAADQQRRADEIYPSTRKGQPVITPNPPRG